MPQVTVGPKYQVVIPREIRKKVHLKKGERVSISSNDEKRIVIELEKKSLADQLAGLGKEVWDKLGGADAYIERERNSWGDR